VNKVLWTLQVLLGLFYALASGMPKLVFLDQLPPPPIPLAIPFVQFIGVCEVLGGLGLILPGITRIRPGLTPLAAAGLVIITVGAVGYNLMAGWPESAVFAVVVALLVAFVGYGRWRLHPHRARPSGSGVTEPAF
jgi:O-antigen/teichoic acid export membrane protein